MPKYLAEPWDVDTVSRYLAQFPELGHLRVRRRSDLLTLESGPDQDPIRHIRFRRDTVHLWLLEVADHRGHWERTPFRALLKDLLDQVTQQFGWLLVSRD